MEFSTFLKLSQKYQNAQPWPKRTDIFGIDETGVGKEVGEQKKLQQEIGWDGHAKTADSAMSRQNRKDEEEAQRRRDQYNKGILPDDLKVSYFLTSIHKAPETQVHLSSVLKYTEVLN